MVKEEKSKGLFIALDANIGAGKTNACHAIASAASTSGWPARVLEEPTHLPRFKHFLSHYYDDLLTGNNTGGGFEMQMFMLCQRYEQHRLAVELAWGEQGIVVVQDRPIYGDTVFATTAMERGFMTKEEYVARFGTEEGVTTAGNSCPTNAGASTILLMSKEAMDKYNLEDYDVVIVDLKLPGRDGLSVTGLLRLPGRRDR